MSDASDGRDRGTDRDPIEEDGSGEDDGSPAPDPLHDEAVAELVRDAVGVARGELSDERFSAKYGTATQEPSRDGR